MKLIAYNLDEPWPQIRPAPSTRPWLDKLPQAFAYRCLPLNIGCSHGWEVLCPVGFEASWNGKDSNDGIWIRQDRAHAWKPQAHFSNGILTFHPHHLFRTETGYNMFVTGPTNMPKHGIAPLTAVVETDWAPYTFTMNWKFTAPGTVRFEEGEPFCLFFPVARGLLDGIAPELMPLAADPETKGHYEAWKASRDQFNQDLHDRKTDAVQEKWQKTYYRGLLPGGAETTATHQIKLQLKPFVAAAGRDATVASPRSSPPEPNRSPRDDASRQGAGAAEPAPASTGRAGPETAVRAVQAMVEDFVAGGDPGRQIARLAATGISEPEARRLVENARSNPLVQTGRAATMRARKREWLLDVIEGHRRLSPAASRIERAAGLGADEFFERYYALHRPVVLPDKIADWPARSTWTPERLRRLAGSRAVAYRGAPDSDSGRGGGADRAAREMPFDQLIDTIERRGAGTGAYAIALDSQDDGDPPALLRRDLGSLDEFLERHAPSAHGRALFGGAGTLTPMHHDLANAFIVQLVGRKRMKIVPAADVSRIYNSASNCSDVSDFDSLDLARYPLLRDLRAYDVTLNPGEILFLPIGWWRQEKWLDFGVAIEYTNFRWPNRWDENFPAE